MQILKFSGHLASSVRFDIIPVRKSVRSFTIPLFRFNYMWDLSALETEEAPDLKQMLVEPHDFRFTFHVHRLTIKGEKSIVPCYKRVL